MAEPSLRPQRFRLDVVAVVLSCVAAAGTVWQAREAIAARQAAERSARAADAAARAAERVERLTEASLRARLVVSRLTLQQPLRANWPVVLLTDLENTGHSDATNVQIRMAAVAGTIFPSGEMPLALSPIAGPRLLEAGVTSTANASIQGSEQTPETVRSLVAGHASLFVYGIVSYESFRETHETRFCFTPSVTKFTVWGTCPRWNDAH